MSRKIGRNAPCPCGSGKKNKHCHKVKGLDDAPQKLVPDARMQAAFRQMEAQRLRKEQQQGRGKGIISADFKGHKVVAVGSEVHFSKKVLTFHDFLIEYVRKTFDRDWGKAEYQKPYEERHPIMQWDYKVVEHQKSSGSKEREVTSAAMTGAVASYLQLGYDLYTLAHNVELQQRMVNRLMNRDQFHGAYYELYVTASLIRAGYDVELEDEEDGSTSHCEFTARHRETGKSFSVEAKARHVAGQLGIDEEHGTIQPDKIRLWARIKSALKKRADHVRIVFVDVNVDEKIFGNEDFMVWMRPALEELRRIADNMKIEGSPAPPAYVFLTNHPYHYDIEGTNYRTMALVDEINIPDFTMIVTRDSLPEMYKKKMRHVEIHELLKSILGQSIPSTFNGEMPEYAYEYTKNAPLIIGNKYLVPNADGKEVEGELVDAVVIEETKTAHGIYTLGNGSSIHASCPLDEAEIDAYRRHPDTFFGVKKDKPKEPQNPFEWFEFFFETYRHSTKEKLLEFMASAKEIDNLKSLPQEELAMIYCEGIAWSAVHDTHKG